MKLKEKKKNDKQNTTLLSHERLDGRVAEWLERWSHLGRSIRKVSV